MAILRKLIVIEDMADGDANELSCVEVAEVEADPTCIKVKEMGDLSGEAVWFDIEGARLLRNFIDGWLGGRTSDASAADDPT